MRDLHGSTTLCAIAVLLWGCSEGGPSPATDGGLDGLHDTTTAQLDVPALDVGEDASADAGLDFPSLPEGGYDFPMSDAPLSGATVLYLIGDNKAEVGLRTVPANGSAAPTPVAGFSGLLSLGELSLAGQHTSVPLRSDLPRVIDQGFPRVRLPDGSALFYVH
ncbi:MAG: hypothetical protein JRH20_15245, partial [Deltaproteobacteria bacterium]|nr:hypothetical protein [Deltaproteobacteria bacterium]